MLGISSSDAKLANALAISGLDAGLNYSENPEWDQWVLDETAAKVSISWSKSAAWERCPARFAH